jgi:ABC-2 type transport system ATP-binding protein
MSIELKNVVKTYANAMALSGVDLEVRSGSIHGFLGPNGAGKTTTMNIICGLLKANSGIIKINDRNIEEHSIDCKRLVGYLPESPPLYLDQSVDDFLIYLARLRGVKKSELKARLESTIERCELGEVRHKLNGNLSKGYKQRVGLAQALIHDPEIVILDEPTNGLDPNAIKHMRDLIKDLKQEHTVLLSSHLLHEVSDMCDTITLINQGKVVRTGPKEEFISSIKHDAKMDVVVETINDSAIKKIKEWDLVKSFEVLRSEKQAKLKISFSDQSDHRAEVSRLLIESGAIPLEMQIHKPDLEEAYRGLIS